MSNVHNGTKAFMQMIKTDALVNSKPWQAADIAPVLITVSYPADNVNAPCTPRSSSPALESFGPGCS